MRSLYLTLNGDPGDIVADQPVPNFPIRLPPVQQEAAAEPRLQPRGARDLAELRMREQYRQESINDRLYREMDRTSRGGRRK